MIAVRDRRDAWVGPSSRPEYGLRASLGWWSKCNSFNESEMALFYECMLKCARKLLDTADIVSEAIYQQLRLLEAFGLPTRRRPFRDVR
jgi:hypothetical protein